MKIDIFDVMGNIRKQEGTKAPAGTSTEDVLQAQKGVEDSKMVMQINRLISDPKKLIILLAVVDVLVLLAWNWAYNTLFNLARLANDPGNPMRYLGLGNVLPNFSNIGALGAFGWVLHLLILPAAIAVLDILNGYKIYVSHADILNKGQHGSERWTTVEEIKAQYKEIPDKEKPYEGRPGTIVAHIGDKIYIDDSPVNNLIIGITRSGKGECYVFPSIDVYSRSSQEPSLICTDPKMELYKSSKKTLEERGYDVYLMNLDDPLHSMGFDPLKLCVEAYKKGDYANAELLANSFSYSVFNSSQQNGGDEFFTKTATILSTALIIAMIEDCIAEDERVNKKRLAIWKQGRSAFDALEEEDKANERYNFREYMKAKEEERKKDPTKDKVDPLQDPDIEYIPDDYEFVYRDDNAKKINIYSILNNFTELSNVRTNNPNISGVDLYFTQRPKMDRAKIKYSSVELSGDRTKGSIYASMLADFTIFTFENVAKMTCESTINLRDIGFGDRPVAVFLGIPDYDKSTHFLASVFIRQVYFALAKEATNTKSGKCTRQVKFICDEFGNLPSIEAMDSIITVCLGRNISFDMYIQAYAQLRAHYGDDMETIVDNCGNQIYILTNDSQTAESFSKLIGSRTRISLQRSGGKMSLNKQFTENVEEEPLLNPNRLMSLLPGEIVVKRVMKREDLQHNPVHPHPIFNSVETGTAFKYRWQYLKDTFPDPDTYSIRDVNTEDRSKIDLTTRVWDFKTTFQRQKERLMIEEQKNLMNSLNDQIPQSLPDDETQQPAPKNERDEVETFRDNGNYSSIKEFLIEHFGKNYENETGIRDDMPIYSMIGILQSDTVLRPDDRKTLLTMINYGIGKGIRKESA